MSSGRRGHSPPRKPRPAARPSPDSDSGSDDLDLRAFAVHLGRKGLCVRDVEADGSCMFRAVSDQLYGDETHHYELRKRCVKYMVDHSADFAPFVDDSKSFSDYTAHMLHDGIWGGNVELQALSMVLRANIYIHTVDGANFEIRNHLFDNAPCLHLSYHHGQHYASVRPIAFAQAGTPAAHPPLGSRTSNVNLDSSSSQSQRGKTTPEHEEILLDVRERAGSIESSVASSVRKLRVSYSAAEENLRASSSDSHSSKHVARREATRRSLEDEAAAVRDLLSEALLRATKLVVAVSGDADSSFFDKRSTRSLKRVYTILDAGRSRAADFDKDVAAFCLKLAQCPCQASNVSSSAAGVEIEQGAKSTRLPRKKKVQETKKAERKARRTREQERRAIDGDGRSLQHDDVNEADSITRDVTI
jgi:OTU-like cysteine protease